MQFFECFSTVSSAILFVQDRRLSYEAISLVDKAYNCHISDLILLLPLAELIFDTLDV